MADSFDVIVIDAGRGALRGLRVAMVEESMWGGCRARRRCTARASRRTRTRRSPGHWHAIEPRADAGDLIHLPSPTPDRGAALRLLAAGRYNHPARAEELLNATETLAGKWGLGGRLFG